VSSKQLAMTGAGTITIGGIAFASWSILLIAVGIVILGAVLIRVAFRRRRGPGQ
jgi:hypothetical protein